MTKAITDRPLFKNGRKPKKPPADAAIRIEELAADGFSIIGIAKRLGTSFDTLHRWLDENPALQAAFDNGRENERYCLHNMLYRSAIEKGNVVAALFLLKSRHGYREGDQSESGNRVQILFQLPAALTMDAFQTLKVVEDASSIDRHKQAPTQRLIAARGS